MSVQDHSHRQTWDLIPLLANGSATVAERALAQAHLSDCADCRDEHAFQMRLQAGMTAEVETDSGAHARLRHLLQRIDDEDRASVVRQPPRSRVRGAQARRASARTPSRRLLAAVLMQSVALVLLGVFVLADPHSRAPASVPTHDGADYRVFSRTSDAVADAAIRLVPTPSLRIAELQSLLTESGLHIVSANHDNTIYSLALANSKRMSVADRDAQVSRALARLRAQPGILLAEPIVTGTTRPALQ